MTFSFGFRANLELPTTTEKPALGFAGGAVLCDATAPLAMARPGSRLRGSATSAALSLI